MKIGLLQLTDSAPVVMARRLGHFTAEGVDVTLSVEPSWANIADKLVHGFLDAAVIVPPLAFAMVLGHRGRAHRLIVPQAVSLGGNTITLEKSLADRMSDRSGSVGGRAQAFAEVVARAHERPTLAVVHTFSTHNLLLRYWLAVGGINPDTEVNLVVIPPAQTAEALASGRIAGFCAGAPWGAVAERKGVGVTVATSHDIWRNGPEKVLAVSEDWANANPDQLQRCLRALLRSAQYCDDPGNAGEIAETLSAELGVDGLAIRDSLSPSSSVFFRHAAAYPWRSHAEWFLQQMGRWKLCDEIDAVQVARQVYRPDLYAQAARSLGMPVPRATHKSEGHSSPWEFPGDPAPIPMEPDGFCDGTP